MRRGARAAVAQDNEDITFHEGDCRDVLRRMAATGELVHSVVTDPPYHLESVVKRFGSKNAAAAKVGSDGRFARQSKGFMGQQWDGAEDGRRIAQDPEFWRLVYDVLLPGGYVLAFSSPRTGHRQAVAMEDAGFIMHPFLGWCFGSGFPKGVAVTRGAPEAEEWEGWYYGTQSLKPALEPIYMAQKPFAEKTGFGNVLKHGTGAVNIDACRVEAADNPVKWEAPRGGIWRTDSEAKAPLVESEKGRWPANLIHDGSDEVLACFPQSKGQQAPVRGTEKSRTGDENANTYGKFGRVPFAARGDTGSAARFFYCAKATKADRAGSKHPTVKPIALLRWLCRLVTPPGGVILDPFAGSGTTGEAARLEGFRAVLIEREAEYAADIRRRFGLPAEAEEFPEDILEILGPLDDPEILELLG